MVREHHYSGKPYPKSQLNLGVYVRGQLEGAMQFGPPLDQRKVIGLVRDTPWRSMIELNRLAFGPRLPRNSESRALGVAFRMMRRHRPDIKWILSYSDATQCGDGAIYRASGFLLTGIRKNTTLYRMPCGAVVTTVGIRTGPALQRKYGYRPGDEPFHQWADRVGAKRMVGYQLRYIRFLDPAWRDRLTVPVIPFDQIPDDARMYRGSPSAGLVGGSGVQPVVGGAGPTPALHPSPGALDG